MAKWKRYILGDDENGRSRVLETEASMVKESPGNFYRVEVWATAEMPVDNRIEGDRSLASRSREPLPNGVTCRMLEIQPDHPDPAVQRRAIEQLHREAHQRHLPTEADYARHPSMHRTDTCDFICCVKGEIFLLTDEEEVLMRPGDSVVIRGSNRGWSNRSDSPTLLAITLIDARLGA